MSPDLPQFIEPVRLADGESPLQGTLDTTTMERLRAVILDCSGPVELNMVFSRDERGVIRITGDYRVKLRMRCQRCLEDMEITLSKPFNIGLVAGGDDVPLSDEFEQVAMEEREIALVPLIEDEVLLGLPMSPMHAPEDCSAKELRDEEPEKSSPFAVLKNLKHDET